MASNLLFQEDAYLKEQAAVVSGVYPGGQVAFSDTIFYARSGGQPGDLGIVISADGTQHTIRDSIYRDGKTDPVVIVDDPSAFSVGERVVLQLDWQHRHRLMRVHTAMHLLTVALPYPVTGGQMDGATGRLDFSMKPTDVPSKDELGVRLNELIALDRQITTRWIAEAELDLSPELVKTMMVKPPAQNGQIRLVEIDGVDLQPCGGTHVANTSEIGAVRVKKIENKGAQNRRVKIELC